MPTVRWAFVLTLIVALNPSFAEAAGMVAQYARTGAITHEAPTDEGSDGRAPAHHHCGCCAHRPLASVEPLLSLGVLPPVASWVSYEDVPWADVVGPPLFRPPIR